MNSEVSRGSPRPNVTKPDVVWLPPDVLVPNPWNPNKMDAFMYAKALESVKEYGFVDPVTARPFKGKLQIIDGEHRWKVALDLRLDLIPIFVIELDDRKAKKLTILLNELRGNIDPVGMTELLKELMAEESIESLTTSLPFTEDAIKKMVEMTAIDWDLPEVPKPTKAEGEKERWVERTYRFPASAAMVLDEAIEKAKDGEAIENWQALERIAADFLS